MSMYTLRQAIADERRCWLLLKRLRWPGRVTCPKCGGRVGPPGGDARWWCGGCRRRFSVTSGTVLHGRRLTLTQMVWIVGLLEFGVPSLVISETVGATDKTVRGFVWAVGGRLGEVQDLLDFIGVSEADEGYWGGRRKGKRGRGAAGKTPMLGLKSRPGGTARALAVPNAEGSTLRREIRRRVAVGSKVLTDMNPSYDRLWEDGYDHGAINHDEGFALGEIHTQGVEGFWGHLKPSLQSRHRHLSPRHLQSYLDLFTWKFGRAREMDFLTTTLIVLLRVAPPTT